MFEISAIVFLFVLISLALYLGHVQKNRIENLERSQKALLESLLIAQKDALRAFNNDKDALLEKIHRVETNLAKIDGILERTLINYRGSTRE